MKLLEMPEFKASDYIATDVEAMAQMSAAIKRAFPVGCVWISFDNTSPADIIGGNWKKIEGRFLWAAGMADSGETWATPGQVGGCVAHKHLTSMGFDRLRFFGMMGDDGNPFYESDVADRKNFVNVAVTNVETDNRVRIAKTAHERHMPPFIVVNMWQRVG